MKTIMFNDEPYGLTDAVLSGVKTQTRRIVPDSHIKSYQEYLEQNPKSKLSIGEYLIKRGFARYTIGEVVAIAQSYKNAGLSPSFCHTMKDHSKKMSYITPVGEQAGWKNKMYVCADFMPHQIKIIGVRVEKLQSISEDDIAAEGVMTVEPFKLYTTNRNNPKASLKARNPKGAYARLIDGVSKKKVYRHNPFVYVFEFELIG